jgi:hypothetical protein
MGRHDRRQIIRACYALKTAGFDIKCPECCTCAMWVRSEEGYGTFADCQRFADDGLTYQTQFDDFCSDWVPRNGGEG